MLEAVPMGFPFRLAVRYMSSKKRASVSMGTFFAIIGVALGVAGLATAMSVTGGFHKQFRDKVLGVNAHVLVLKRAGYFYEYRDVMEQMKEVPGVTGVAPFTVNPMMLTRGDRTATSVLLKGIEPELSVNVLDLPHQIVEGNLEGLRLPDAAPPQRKKRSSSRAKQKESEAEENGAQAQDKELSTEELLKQIATTIERKEEEPAVPSELSELPEDALVGSIVPEGGYGSELPEDDILPEFLNPDPCSDESAQLSGIVLGKTLSKNLDAQVGDCVQVTSPTIGFSFSQDTIRAPVAKQFRVIAIFDAGFDQYDAKLAFVDLYQAQEFAESGDSVTGVEMKVTDIDGARKIARAIDEILEGSALYTMDWEELNHGLFTALRIQQVLMSIILALIIVVAAFTVIATLIMVVLDKKKEIAVLKAMGASNSAILRSFLYQGGIIGFIGGAVGLLVAWAVCKLLLVYVIPLDPKVYFISQIPVDVQLGQFLFVGVFAVLVCLGATWWPALYAARLRPAEAFREQ